MFSREKAHFKSLIWVNQKILSPIVFFGPTQKTERTSYAGRATLPRGLIALAAAIAAPAPRHSTTVATALARSSATRRHKTRHFKKESVISVSTLQQMCHLSAQY